MAKLIDSVKALGEAITGEKIEGDTLFAAVKDACEKMTGKEIKGKGLNDIIAETAAVKTKYVLAGTFDPDAVYYERVLTPHNPSVVEGTYAFVDKSYCGSIRVDFDRFYGGSGGDGDVSHTFILEGKEPSQTTSGEWAWIGNFKIWRKSYSPSVLINYGMDNGRNNGGPRMQFYDSMPNNLQVSYSGNCVLMSIFDSTIINNLREFTDLCTVKISDLIMGTDFQNRAELLQLENKTSIEDWVNELTSYRRIDLTQQDFVACKYFIKTIDE